MTTHLSARLAWHDNGWNGRVCTDPASNVYCTGSHSFPGQKIAKERDLEWESTQVGMPCEKCDRVLPCSYSINAFGFRTIKASESVWDRGKSKKVEKTWDMPPASVCTWPFEETVETIGRNRSNYRRSRSRRSAEKFFSKLEENKSLIFYYVNFSNPIDIQEEEKYIVVGISRIKEIGEQLLRETTENSNNTGPVKPVWARVIQSTYSDEGFCIPYHVYANNEPMLERMKFIPVDQHVFKFGARHVSDDDAITLIEKFIEIATILEEEGDSTENWTVRIRWLVSLIGELWKSRGCYPGILKILDCIDFYQAIDFFMKEVTADPGIELTLKENLFSFLNGNTQQIDGLTLSLEEIEKIRKSWNTFSADQKEFLELLLPRIDLSKEQLEIIISEEDRPEFGIDSPPKTILENPYILFEEYGSDDPSDCITFEKIDNGVFPSPDLGDMNYQGIQPDDPRRLRALLVNFFKSHVQHACVPVESVLYWINNKISFYSLWKQHNFTINEINNNADLFSPAITLREIDDMQYLYLKEVFDNERFIEQKVNTLLGRPDHASMEAITIADTKEMLADQESPINIANPEVYDRIITNQAHVCNHVIKKNVAIVTGGAGTGKTRIVKTIINLIEKVEGAGSSILLLAPTGRASDRLHEATGRIAMTVHLFLARTKWMRKNLTFRREGGDVTAISNIIIDEASMLNLTLVTTLCKAIEFDSIRRLIFVGDASQLPPIGTGKVFADLNDFLADNYPDNIAVLQDNVRQRLNVIQDLGTSILSLAETFKRTRLQDTKDPLAKQEKERIISKLASGGDIDKDLRTIYWEGKDDLKQKLLSTIARDIYDDLKIGGNNRLEAKALQTFWNSQFTPNDYRNLEMNYLQILSPYHNNFFGVDSLNALLQSAFNPSAPNGWEMKGFKKHDKVIQCINRLSSNPLKATYLPDKVEEDVQVFNGEIGVVTYLDFKSDPKIMEVYIQGRPFHRVKYPRNEIPENLELAYAISVHKSQGSEFKRVYFIVPRSRPRLLKTELIYTAITRAKNHCTLLIEKDATSLLNLAKPENSLLNQISTSLFTFKPIAIDLFPGDWYPERKIHATKAGTMVRSKSEVVIANLLLEKGIAFSYEKPLIAPDKSGFLPDFTITWHDRTWYWEHLGNMDDEGYKNHWAFKKAWYEAHGFSDQLIVSTEEQGLDSQAIAAIIDEHFTERTN